MRAAWQVSIRRACAALQAERSSYHYKAKRADQAALKARIKEIAETRVRYGYRRITVLLKREGWPVNGKRIYKLYKELGLQLWRDDLDERRATIRMRIVSRSVRMIVAARHERKPFNLPERRSG